jgi:MYXO-CTERM domain-containing protein
MFTRFLTAVCASALCVTSAFATDGMSLTETSYSGAIMLEPGLTVETESFDMGEMSHSHDQKQYAYWSGNTLYVGAEDEFGNGIDGIVEFFWFESSIDRGADFYVAIIKARTTPNVMDDWYLMEDDTKPVQKVSAHTNISREAGAFRWDWSLPFENYGMDSYGQVSLKNSYGIGAGAEGSAMYGTKYNKDGVKAEVNVQAKGFVDSEYRVTTNYTTELWSWYTRVRGAPDEMTWTTTLDNHTKTEESSYHEYFLVMQSEEGVPFTIDTLMLGATVDEWWWGVWNELSVQLNNVTLYQPEFIVDEEEEEEELDVDDEEEEEEEESPEDGLEWDTGSVDLVEVEEEEEAGFRLACNSAMGATQMSWLLMGLGGLVATRRRRE